MQTETWKDVIGFEGFYQVSDLGRVRSLDRYVVKKDGSAQVYKGRIMRAQLAGGNNGDRRYLHICLSNQNQRIGVFVHQLVAWSFLGDPPEGCDVHHRNECPTDNCLSNLEYKPKTQHLSDHHRGSNNHEAILTEPDIVQIRRMIAEKQALAQIARLFGVSKSTIWRIKRGESWRHVPADLDFAAMLDDLRSGQTEPLARLTKAQLDEIEAERPGQDFSEYPDFY